MGFWHHFARGQATWSDSIVKKIIAAQKAGKEIAIPERLKKDIEEFPQYSQKNFPGHAAWNVWPWKLHRIERGAPGKATFKLYNLEKDPLEANDLAKSEKVRLAAMKKELLQWQRSVINSLNGKDYKMKGN